MLNRSLVPYDGIKRTIDLVISAVLFVGSLPLQGLVALAVCVRLGRPVLFRQERPGLNGEPFTLVKFRTMRMARPNEDVSSDEARLSRFGAFLRATSLDELPTLLNVVKGDMSLVGPRPLLMAYLDRYSPVQARRHDVRPGITGLAQVNGRNAIVWEDKLRLDVEYVDRRSLRLDVKILIGTVFSVLGRRGITAEGHATTSEFMGSPKGER